MKGVDHGHSAESCGLFHLFQKFIDITRQNILVWWAMHGRVNAIDFRACIMLMMVFTMRHVRLQIQRKRYCSQFQVAKYLSLPWISKAIYASEKNNYIGFRRQTCEKPWYLNINLRFALENLFSFNISFSLVISKGIIHHQSSQNEILRYSSWNFATTNSFKIRYSWCWLLLR